MAAPPAAMQPIGWNKWGLKTDFKRRLIGEVDVREA
jgi:hypothetical protein